jgi:hypothetical protein
MWERKTSGREGVEKKSRKILPIKFVVLVRTNRKGN